LGSELQGASVFTKLYISYTRVYNKELTVSEAAVDILHGYRRWYKKPYHAAMCVCVCVCVWIIGFMFRECKH